MKPTSYIILSRFGAYAPRSPEIGRGSGFRRHIQFSQPRLRPAEIVLVARLVQLKVNGRREQGNVL